MKKFKNISGENLFVRGYGLVKSGATVIFKNLNKKKFEQINEEVKEKLKGKPKK